MNVTGLDAEGQYSSAMDMIRLGTHLMSNPSFQLTVERTDAVLHDLRYPATNDLLTLYPGADGIKSGHTTEAGWCLLGSATRERPAHRRRRARRADRGGPQRRRHHAARLGVPRVAITAFPGHAVCRLRSCWPLARWRSLARIRDIVGR